LRNYAVAASVFRRLWASNLQYAVLADIHGNFAACETVWRALEAAGLTGQTVLNAGDNVGYGSSPEACIQFLQVHSNIVTVRGNYDKNVALFPEREAEYRKKWGRVRPEKYEALRHDSETISEESRRWLRDLPGEAALTLDGISLLLTHYAPGCKRGLGAWTTDNELRELAAETSARVVVCGHTHTPFVRSVGGVLWVNPGSLGRSFDGRFRYAILTLDAAQEPQAQLKYTR